MQISKKDWIFIAIVVTVIAIFIAISGEETTTKVPLDPQHAPAYQLMKETGSKMEVDKTCPSCHFEPGGIPFPPNHPVKPKEGPMRCLFCHKLHKDGK